MSWKALNRWPEKKGAQREPLAGGGERGKELGGQRRRRRTRRRWGGGDNLATLITATVDRLVLQGVLKNIKINLKSEQASIVTVAH